MHHFYPHEGGGPQHDSRCMRGRPGPLLCELHAHTCWSDGTLTVSELVDLYGRNGFDVLCITDHVVRRDDPWLEVDGWDGSSVDAASWESYLAEVDREAERARTTYGMLVVPGLELTYNDTDPAQAAHAVALGLRSFVSVDHGIAEAIETAVEAGAAVIAAHPFDGSRHESCSRLTHRVGRRREPAGRLSRDGRPFSTSG